MHIASHHDHNASQGWVLAVKAGKLAHGGDLPRPQCEAILNLQHLTLDLDKVML